MDDDQRQCQRITAPYLTIHPHTIKTILIESQSYSTIFDLPSLRIPSLFKLCHPCSSLSRQLANEVKWNEERIPLGSTKQGCKIEQQDTASLS